MTQTQVLTLDQVARMAPSVFSQSQMPGLSSKYAFVPTSTIVERMANEGWAVTRATESRVRTAQRQGFQKHMLRFARVEDLGIQEEYRQSLYRTHARPDRRDPRSRRIEVILTNAHDGLCSYTLESGVFELVCANGMVVCSSSFGSLHVRHTGDPNEIIGASYSILDNTEALRGTIDEWSKLTMSDDDRLAFALRAANLRYDFDTTKPDTCPIFYDRLLSPRRTGDHLNDLWTVTNVVQENVMKGGLRAMKVEDGRGGFSDWGANRMRQIKSVDADLKFNRGLWELAADFAQHLN